MEYRYGGAYNIVVASRQHASAREALRKVLRRARKDAGLTQVDLAKKLRRDQSFISKYERGERTLDVAEFCAVAEAIGVDPQQLLKKAGLVQRRAR